MQIFKMMNDINMQLIFLFNRSLIHRMIELIIYLKNANSVPTKIKVYITRMFWYLKSIFHNFKPPNKLSNDEIELRIWYIIFFVIMHAFWIPYSKRWNISCFEIFSKLSDIFQSVKTSEFIQDHNIKAIIVYIKNWILLNEGPPPNFSPEYPRNEIFSSIFTFSMSQLYTLQLWWKSFYKQYFIFKDEKSK